MNNHINLNHNRVITFVVCLLLLPILILLSSCATVYESIPANDYSYTKSLADKDFAKKDRSWIASFYLRRAIACSADNSVRAILAACNDRHTKLDDASALLSFSIRKYYDVYDNEPARQPQSRQIIVHLADYITTHSITAAIPLSMVIERQDKDMVNLLLTYMNGRYTGRNAFNKPYADNSCHWDLVSGKYLDNLREIKRTKEYPPPIVLALYQKDISLLRLLTENGADINNPIKFSTETSSPEVSPLGLAVFAHDTNWVSRLASEGVDVNAICFSYANRNFEKLCDTINSFTGKNDCSHVIDLLPKEKFSYVRSNVSPLTIALLQNDNNMVQTLIERGARTILPFRTWGQLPQLALPESLLDLIRESGVIPEDQSDEHVIRKFCYPGEVSLESFASESQPISPSPLSPASGVFPKWFRETNSLIWLTDSNSPLHSIADRFSQFKHITGFHYDASKQELIFIGEKSSNTIEGIRFDDFLTAARSASFGEVSGVTIDPCSNKNIMAVRYFGKTEGTHFGFVTFAADLFMKISQNGYDNYNRRTFKRALDAVLPCYEQWAKSSIEEHMSTGESWQRFWLEPSKADIIEYTNNCYAFSVKTGVNTEWMKGNRDPEREANANYFANYMTTNMTQVMNQYPIFLKLQQLFEIDCILKCMADKSIPIDEEWLSVQLPECETPRETPAISIVGIQTFERFTRIRMVYGGVDFQYVPRYTRKNILDDRLLENLLRLRPHNQEPTWEVPFEGKIAIGMAIPISKPLILPPPQKWNRPDVERIPIIGEVWRPAKTENSGTLVCRNLSSKTLTVSFSQSGYSFTLAPGASTTETFVVGHYSCVVTTPGVSPMAAGLDIKSGSTHTWNLSVRTEKSSFSLPPISYPSIPTPQLKY